MPNLVTPLQLSSSLADVQLIILDCRCDLGDPHSAHLAYKAGHIPGAIYAHLEDDLSAEIIAGKTGRHPLPSQEQWQATLRKWGAQQNTRFVVYDQRQGMFAARAWWMLKWAGFEQVQLLNGGLDAWVAAGLEMTTDLPTVKPSALNIIVDNRMLVTAEQIVNSPTKHTLLDARALPRYLGEVEPLDQYAGHIPGAHNADFSKSCNANGELLQADALAKRFESITDKDVACYCGSGVTACHNILAIHEAGLPLPKLYPGSWSEWILDDTRKRAKGSEGVVI